MTAALVIILPADPEDPPQWLKVVDGAVAERGTGETWGIAPDDPDATLLIAPAAAITLHRASLPDLAPRQAVVAARLLALESSLSGPDGLHVATGPRDSEGVLDVAVVRDAAMVGWLAWARQHAVEPGAIVPAALLLPRPDLGFVSARIGDEDLLRDASSAFADDGVGARLVGDAPLLPLGADEIDASIVAALSDPPLNLLQGAFARRRRIAIDWRDARRAAVFAGLILLALFATVIVRIVRLHADTAARDAAAVAAAQALAPEVTTATEAEAAINARLLARGVGGRSFADPTAQLLAAMQPLPDIMMTNLARSADGGLAVTLSAASVDQVDAVLVALQRAGYVVTAEAPQNQGGRNAVAITVAAP